MEKVEVKNRTHQQEKTHGRTTNRISNKDEQKASPNKLLSLKTSALIQTRLRAQRQFNAEED